jgi:hypothetical protein
VSIDSSVSPSGFDNFEGTSMSTPHVAGAWAIARQVSPTATTQQIEDAFKATGKPVTDFAADPDLTRDRIRVLSAGAHLAHSGMRITRNFGPLAGLRVAHDGIGLAKRTNGGVANSNPPGPPLSGNFNITGIPIGSTIVKTFIVYQVLGGPDPTFTFKNVARTATLIGASGQFTCWLNNNGGAYRTYLFEPPVGAVPGNGLYQVSGIGLNQSAITGRPDGQGASLIVLYTPPGGGVQGRAFLRFGAMTARPNLTPMSFTFTGLTVPAGATARSWHVGMGDGEAAFADPQIKFRNISIPPSNRWVGSDGNYWDHDLISLTGAQLPAGATAAVVSQAATAECLTMAFSGLVIR